MVLDYPYPIGREDCRSGPSPAGKTRARLRGASAAMVADKMSLYKLFNFERLARSIKTRGLWGVLRHLWYRLSEKYHERRLGLHSWEDVYLRKHEEHDCFCYRATDYGTFRRIIKHLKVGNAENVFIDYGSGKGRAVIIAALYPFGRVIGVEVSAELNAVARANVERARPKLKCKDIELITSDAAEFRLPPDVTVAYFYNPFRGKILEAVLEDMHRSLVEAPRKLVVIFKNPEPSGFEDYAAHCGWMTKRREFESPSKLAQPLGIYDAVL